jgi:FK506-binding protein 1
MISNGGSTEPPTAMPNFGAIKQLQARCTGAPRALCKKALEDNGDDENLAAKHISDTTEFKDTRAPAEHADPLANLNLADHLAGRPVLEVFDAENTTVTVIRIEEGDREAFPSYGDTLRVHYKGMLEDGTVFDSSHERRAPFDFKFGKGEVIKGWDEGFAKMSLGEKAMILIPSAKAYGASGTAFQGGVGIPPHADLKFEVQLLKITRQTSCLGAGQHGGVQKKNHEYTNLAKELLGQA